jgi:hypothetical protein
MQEELESGQPIQGGLVARWQLPAYWQFGRNETNSQQEGKRLFLRPVSSQTDAVVS